MKTAALLTLLSGEPLPPPPQEVEQLALLALARVHGVLRPLAQAWQDLELAPAARATLAALLRAQSMTALTQAGALAEVLRRSEAAGWGVIPYKGPLLSLRLYGDLAWRPSIDLDLLLPPAKRTEVYLGLRELGYEPIPEAGPRSAKEACASRYAWLLQHPRTGVYLDAETSPLSPLFPQVFASRFFSASDESVLWEGIRVPQTAPEILFLALAAHAAKHRGGRLMWLLDLRALAGTPGFDWEEVTQLAREVRLEEPLRWGVSWLRTLDPTLPALPPPRAPLGALYVDAEPERTIGSDYAAVLHLARIQDRWRDRIGVLVKKALLLHPCDRWALPPEEPGWRVAVERLTRLAWRFLRWSLGRGRMG